MRNNSLTQLPLQVTKLNSDTYYDFGGNNFGENVQRVVTLTKRWERLPIAKLAKAITDDQILLLPTLMIPHNEIDYEPSYLPFPFSVIGLDAFIHISLLLDVNDLINLLSVNKSMRSLL